MFSLLLLVLQKEEEREAEGEERRDEGGEKETAGERGTMGLLASVAAAASGRLSWLLLRGVATAWQLA